MGTLICSAGIYAEIESAIRVLREIHPTSPISVWWDHEGNRSSFLIPDENIPATDRAVITDNISYLRQVLQDAVDTRDVADIEYVVTRLVSDIEDVIAHYRRQWVYLEAKSAVTKPDLAFESVEVSVDYGTLPATGESWEEFASFIFSSELQWKFSMNNEEVFEFNRSIARPSSDSAA